jgi:hypothetical protein
MKGVIPLLNRKTCQECPSKSKARGHHVNLGGDGLECFLSLKDEEAVEPRGNLACKSFQA